MSTTRTLTAGNQSKRVGRLLSRTAVSIAAGDSGMMTRGSTGSLVLKACVDAAPRRPMRLDVIFRRQEAREFRKVGAISAIPDRNCCIHPGISSTGQHIH